MALMKSALCFGLGSLFQRVRAEGEALCPSLAARFLFIAFSPLALWFKLGPQWLSQELEMQGQQGSKTTCPDPLVYGVGRRENDASLGKRGNLVMLGRDVCFLSALSLVLPTQWVCHGHRGRGQDSPSLLILGCVSPARPSGDRDSRYVLKLAKAALSGLCGGWGVRKLGKAWSRGMTGSAQEAEKLWAAPEAPLFVASKVCSLAFLGQLPSPVPCLGLLLPLGICVKATRPCTCEGLPISFLGSSCCQEAGPGLRRGTQLNVSRLYPQRGSKLFPAVTHWPPYAA